MGHKVSWDRGASYEDVVEAVRRVFVRDGVPRHVYADGKIMKYDWILSGPIEDNLDGTALEDHVQRMIDGQQG